MLKECDGVADCWKKYASEENVLEEKVASKGRNGVAAAMRENVAAHS